MSNSKLATVKVPADKGNYTKGRQGRKISMITIHHMAGIMTAKQCGKVFQKKGRAGSTHYGVGIDGKIGLYVDEKNTAWSNTNWIANTKSVTIETSNDKRGGKWHVSDKTLNQLIKLVADIAKRNDLGKLVKGKNLTWHSMYCATECPGDYLRSKISYIAEKANEINNKKPAKFKSYKVVIDTDELNVRAKPSVNSKVVTVVKKGEVYTIVAEKNGFGQLKSKIGWIYLKYTKKK